MLFIIFIMLHNMLYWSTQNIIAFTASAINQRRKTGFLCFFFQISERILYTSKRFNRQANRCASPHLNKGGFGEKCNTVVFVKLHGPYSIGPLTACHTGGEPE